MTQTWDKNGKRLAVTVLEAAPLTVTQLKTDQKDSYNSVQVGFGQKSLKQVSNALKKHLKVNSSDKHTFRYLREIRLSDPSDLKPADTIQPTDVLQVGDIVNATAITKGRGFSGAMKRWGFGGGPRTHGQSDRARAVGSIGQGTDPGRVHKGKKMPGHYGNTTKTIKNLQIVNIDSDRNQIWLSGPVPGSRGTVVKLTKIRNSQFVGLRSTPTATQENSNNNQEQS